MTPAGLNTREGCDSSLIVLRCNECGLTKPVGEFVRDRSAKSRGGFKRRCRECDQVRCKRYYRRNRESVLAKASARNLQKRGPRMCAKGCGRKATSQRHIYCGPCRQQAIDDRLQRRGKMSMWGLMLAREKEAHRSARRRELGLTTRARGYDRPYEVERDRVKPDVEAGRCYCARCGLPILPGQKWDLGHDDLDRSVIHGPEHRFSADCPAGGNRATARHAKERRSA